MDNNKLNMPEMMHEFANAKDEFFQNQCQETYDNLSKAFRTLVEKKIWARFPVQERQGQTSHATVVHDGREYIVMFSSDQKVKLDDEISLMVMEFNKGLHTIYNNPHCAGLVIDPFTEDYFYMPLPMLEAMTGVPNPRHQPVDWGEGIPKYEENDLMAKEEILDFGIQIVTDYLTQDGYKVLETTTSPLQPSNIIARKDGQLCSITVKNEIMDISTSLSGMEKKPELSKEEAEKALDFAKKCNAIPYFAPVAFGSRDAERMIKGLALIGDNFYINFTGIEKI